MINRDCKNLGYMVFFSEIHLDRKWTTGSWAQVLPLKIWKSQVPLRYFYKEMTWSISLISACSINTIFYCTVHETQEISFENIHLYERESTLGTCCAMSDNCSLSFLFSTESFSACHLSRRSSIRALNSWDCGWPSLIKFSPVSTRVLILGSWLSISVCRDCNQNI